MTATNELLAKNAGELRKAGRVLYTWTHNGKVFIREKSETPSVRIKVLKDLEKWK